MKLLDANVLLYAYDRSSTHHVACRTWLETAFNAQEAVALPWQTLLAFVRIVTNPRAVRQPLSGLQACEIVTTWLEHPGVVIIGPGDRFWEIFREQVIEAQVSGPLVTDAALASLAMEHGATLCSTDRDFRRFQSIQRFDPTEVG